MWHEAMAIDIRTVSGLLSVRLQMKLAGTMISAAALTLLQDCMACAGALTLKMWKAWLIGHVFVHDIIVHVQHGVSCVPYDCIVAGRCIEVVLL